MNAVTEDNIEFTNITQSLKQEPDITRGIRPEEHGKSGRENNYSRYGSGFSGRGCQSCACAGGGR